VRRKTHFGRSAALPSAFLVAAALPGFANANVTNDPEIEETVIVASRIPVARADTGVSISVVDRLAIETLAYPDVADLLDTQVGVSVSQNGGFGGASSVRIRGEEGFRTRIVLDGIDIADPSSPQISPRFEHLLTAGIDRVEILRGPQGLLWGADAGGVVSISSAIPDRDIDLRLRAETGARGYQQLSANGSVGGSLGGISAHLASLETDGFNARSDDVGPIADDDGYRNTSGHVTGRLRLSDQVHVSATLHDIDGENDYDGCFDASFNSSNRCVDEYRQRAWRVAAGLDTQTSQHELAVSVSDTERDFLTDNSVTYATEGRTEQANLIGSWHLPAALRWTYGIEATEQSFADGFNDGQRDNAGIYTELMHSRESLSLSVGVRHDDNEDFGNFTSWRATGRYATDFRDRRLTLRAAAGTGFRAPSLYEIAYNAGPSGFSPAADQALDAETSRGWELAAAIGDDTFNIELVAFQQTIDDEIFFDLANFSGYLQRGGQSESRGLEAVGRLTLSEHWSIEANAMFNRTEDDNGQDRPYRPEYTARTTLLWQRNQWSGQVTARGAWNAVDTVAAPLEDYVLLDAMLTTTLTGALRLTMRVENLTDADYQQVTPFNTPGRAGYIAIDYGI
jgi:vitamin B12 transporter